MSCGVLFFCRIDHARHFTILGSFRWLCRRHMRTLKLRERVVHFARKRCAAFAVLRHKPIRNIYELLDVRNAVLIYIRLHTVCNRGV